MDALKVISNYIEDAESMQLIQGNGGLEKLLQFIITPATHDIQASALKAISRAAQRGMHVQAQTLILLCQTNIALVVYTCELNQDVSSVVKSIMRTV